MLVRGELATVLIFLCFCSRFQDYFFWNLIKLFFCVNYVTRSKKKRDVGGELSMKSSVLCSDPAYKCDFLS